MNVINYRSKKVPYDYRCSSCGVTGRRLWRLYNDMAGGELRCLECAEIHQHRRADLESSDRIGEYVPAVPSEDNRTWWGYSSVPKRAVSWWKRLPSRRDSDWSQSFSGGRIFAWDPRESDLDIRDIAMGLREPRFCSQTVCGPLYSVAEHSVRASRIVPREWALAALMHDGHEYALKDVPTPVKRRPEMRPYVEACDRLQNVINRWLGLPLDSHEHPEVKKADIVMLATEKRDLMAAPPVPWSNLPAPLTEKIVPWDTDTAAHRFIERFYELTGWERTRTR